MAVPLLAGEAGSEPGREAVVSDDELGGETEAGTGVSSVGQGSQGQPHWGDKGGKTWGR